MLVYRWLENAQGLLEMLIDIHERLCRAVSKDSHFKALAKGFGVGIEGFEILDMPLDGSAYGGCDSSPQMFRHSFPYFGELGDSVVERPLFDALLDAGFSHVFACAHKVDDVEGDFLLYENCNYIVRHGGGHYSRNGE